MREWRSGFKELATLRDAPASRRDASNGDGRRRFPDLGGRCGDPKLAERGEPRRAARSGGS